MRVLLITRETLSAASNEGNVLLNLFSGQPMEFANIYFKSDLPDNDLCAGRYFQLTDAMAAKKLLRREPMGRQVGAGAQAVSGAASQAKSKGFYDFFRKHNWTLFFMAQELLWSLAGFRSEALDRFIEDYHPDVIFAPLCYSRYVLSVQRYVIEKAGCPAATYLYDDLYSLRQWRLSPLYWIHRFLQRRAIRKTLPFYNTVYTMSDQQAAAFQSLLHIPVRVLRKPGPEIPIVSHPHQGIRLIYAGGTYYGRDDTLALVADAVRKLRAEGQDVRLDIYTGSPQRRELQSRLNDGAASFVHEAIPFARLQEEYAKSDIALHVESFQRKYALLTRLSFSTKIVDCLASGCAVLAVCPEMNAGWQYLRDEEAACCVSGSSGIEEAVRSLVLNAALRRQLAARAAGCLARNHDEDIIKKDLYKSLLALAAEGK